MHSSLWILVLPLFPSLVFSAVHNVDVGEDGFVFDPDTVTAAVGDVVNFHFYPGDHSVAQSSFDDPCQPLSGGKQSIYSGFFNPTSGEGDTMFSMPVNSTDPIWLYCSQVGHCRGGMVMVVNPGSGNTLDEYKTAAKSAGHETSPASVFGGMVEPNSDDSESSSTSTGSAESTSMASMGTAAATTTATGAATMTSASPSIATATSSAAALKWQVDMLVVGAVAMPAVSWLLL